MLARVPGGLDWALANPRLSLPGLLFLNFFLRTPGRNIGPHHVRVAHASSLVLFKRTRFLQILVSPVVILPGVIWFIVVVLLLRIIPISTDNRSLRLEFFIPLD